MMFVFSILILKRVFLSRNFRKDFDFYFFNFRIFGGNLCMELFGDFVV